MGMQTDVQASVPITVDGQFTDQAANNLGRTRVKKRLHCAKWYSRKRRV
jgi:hypothetical protein